MSMYIPIFIYVYKYTYLCLSADHGFFRDENFGRVGTIMEGFTGLTPGG